MPGPDGKIGHAELELGDSLIMLADEFPEMGIRGPKAVGGTPVMIMIYVEDADAVFDAAVAAGATALRPMENQFYGDRTGQFEDPFGHRWSVATHVEDVPPDEMEKRAAEAMSWLSPSDAVARTECENQGGQGRTSDIRAVRPVAPGHLRARRRTGRGPRAWPPPLARNGSQALLSSRSVAWSTPARFLCLRS